MSEQEINYAAAKYCPNCNATDSLNISMEASLTFNLGESLGDPEEIDVISQVFNEKGRVITCSECNFELSECGIVTPNLDEEQVANSHDHIKNLEKIMDIVNLDS